MVLLLLFSIIGNYWGLGRNEDEEQECILNALPWRGDGNGDGRRAGRYDLQAYSSRS